MVTIRQKEAMSIWLRNVVAETNVCYEFELMPNVIYDTLEVRFSFNGYNLHFDDWELERLYNYMRETKDLSEIECARMFLKSKLEQKTKEGRRGRKL